MTTTEQFADEFRKAGTEEGVNRPTLIKNEMQFLLASRPDGWEDVGIDSPVMWMEKCGKWFREIVDEDPSLVDDFEKGDEKRRAEILWNVGEKVKAKLLH